MKEGEALREERSKSVVKERLGGRWGRIVGNGGLGELSKESESFAEIGEESGSLAEEGSHS
jgi:hypothetical protein